MNLEPVETPAYEKRLARKFHRLTAATADLAALTALRRRRRTQRMSIRPRPATSPKYCHYNHLHRLATKPGEISELAARHAVFDETFAEIVDELPLAEVHLVLDAGCGDGYFLVQFLSRPKRVHVTGLDPSAAYLMTARSACHGHENVTLVKGVAEHIPCAAESFDLIWSAHSMQSYDNVEAALREFYDVLKPGGTVAILENDRLHARLLPLPPRLEIALLRRKVEAVQAGTATGLFYPRWSDRMLHEAGFVNLQRKTYTFERQTPWDEQEQGYFELMLEDALESAREHLNGGLLENAEELLSPSSKRYLGASELRFFSEFHILFLGNKPEPN